jgi:hypothetical protein
LIHDDIGYRLTRASAGRVEALLAYIAENRNAFDGRRGTVVFSGGWAGAGQDLEPPPERFREGTLMLDRAIGANIEGHKLARYVETYSEIDSDSTLENVLRVKEADYFRGITFTSRNPLGLVAHQEHLNRIDYLVRKVFNLPSQAVTHIVAPGADKTSSRMPEKLILLVTRLIFTGAKDAHTLRRRQRILIALNHALPQGHYTRSETQECE